MSTEQPINEQEIINTLRERLPEDATRLALQRNLQQLNRKHFVVKGKLVSFKKYYARVAAAAIIVFVVLLWPRGSYLDQYGETSMISSTERGAGEDSLLQQASVHFNKNEFKAALPLLNKIVLADSGNQMALYYKGLTQLHLKQYAAAREALLRIYNGTSVFQPDAAFYIGLSYLDEKNREEARKWLLKVPKESQLWEKASVLLEKI